MSIQTKQQKINHIQKAIEQLQKKLTNESSKEARKNDSIRKAVDRLNRTNISATAKSKQREIQRNEKAIIQIQKKKADLNKKIAQKTSSLHKAQNELYKEQDKEQKKLQKEIEHRDRESRRQVSSLLNQIENGNSHITSDSETQEATLSYHAFISHASEDKDDIVRPLSEKLQDQGFDIWYDEFELQVGDSLRRNIDKGLRHSKFGIVILSQNFFEKDWPQYELDGLVQKEILGGKVILPIWHKVTKDEVMKYSPSLADKVALSTASYSIDEIAGELYKALK